MPAFKARNKETASIVSTFGEDTRMYIMVLPDIFQDVTIPPQIVNHAFLEKTKLIYGLTALWRLAPSVGVRMTVKLEDLELAELSAKEPMFEVFYFTDQLAVVGIKNGEDTEEEITFMESFNQKFKFPLQLSFEFEYFELSSAECELIKNKGDGSDTTAMKIRKTYLGKQPRGSGGIYSLEGLEGVKVLHQEDEEYPTEGKIPVRKSRVVIHRGRDNTFLFVNSVGSSEYFALPGGRIEKLSNSRGTAIREIEKELKPFLSNDILDELNIAIAETEDVYYHPGTTTMFYVIKCPGGLQNWNGAVHHELSALDKSSNWERYKIAYEGGNVNDLQNICKVCWKLSGEDDNTFTIPTAIIEDMN